MALRELSSDELRLIRALLGKAKLNSVGTDWLEGVKAQPLKDEGMGSLRFHYDGGDTARRKFGRCASELEFTDSDGTMVLVALYLDEEGRPYELDMWKVDFLPVISIPTEL